MIEGEQLKLWVANAEANLGMRVIVAGSRSITDFDTVCRVIQLSGFVIQVLLSGNASGVDLLGERYARRAGCAVEVYPAEWKKYGKKAGMVRNKFMAERANALIAIWDGQSPGTRHMIAEAEKRGLRTFVHRCLPTPPPDYTLPKGL